MGRTVVDTAAPIGVVMDGATQGDGRKAGRVRDMTETVMFQGLATSIALHRPGAILRSVTYL